MIASGCTNLDVDGPMIFEPDEAGVPEEDLGDHGYTLRETKQIWTNRSASTLAVEHDVHVLTVAKVYQRGQGDTQAAVGAVSTPKTEILEKDFNPIKDMSHREVIERLASSTGYGSIRDLNEVGSAEVPILGDTREVARFEATGEDSDGDTKDLVIHVAKFSDGDDFVVPIGVYPAGEELASGVLGMFEELDHPMQATSKTSPVKQGKDTAVLWRGFRHAWSYNHRFNRLGSWVDNEQCDANGCRYEVGHSAASGSGKDVAAVRDAYTELSAVNVTFESGEESIKLDGKEKKSGPKSQRFKKTVPVTLDGNKHPELLGHNSYTVLLNGFDAKSRGIAAKVIDFGLWVKNARQAGNDVKFDLEYDVLLDCDSFECKGHFVDPNPPHKLRGGKTPQDVNYTLNVRYLVIGGDTKDVRYTDGSTQESDLDWDNCYNNGADFVPDGKRNSDKFKFDPVVNGHFGNHMWCEASGGFSVQHENHWNETGIAGKTAQSPHGYSVGTVGMSSFELDMHHEAHFTQFDAIVGGSYKASEGHYNLHSLPFFKEWSTRPGMYMDARKSYGHDSSAEMKIEPVLIQIADGCKRSFVNGGKKLWKGGGAPANTPAAIVNETYSFSFGDTWYGYHHSRGNYCEHPANPSSASTQTAQKVEGRTLHREDAFPLRDGYPKDLAKRRKIADTGQRIDLWNEFEKPSDYNAKLHWGREQTAEEPTQLRGRPSDRFYASTSDNRPHADISKINVTARAVHTKIQGGGWRVAGTENLTLENLAGDPNARGIEDVAFGDPRAYQEPVKVISNPPSHDPPSRLVQVLINNSVQAYEVEAFSHDVDLASTAADQYGDRIGAQNWFIDEPFDRARVSPKERPNVTFVKESEPGDYAVELLVYCPDESCQPVHGMIPFHHLQQLELTSMDDYHNTTELTDNSARADRDYYSVSLDKAERVANASITGGPGLTLALETVDGRELKTAPNGAELYTNTSTTGPFRLEVRGPGVVDKYTLNLTTQFVSQKFEENDELSTSHDFDQRFDFNDQMQQIQSKRGNNRWCQTTTGQNTNTGSTAGSTGTSTTSTGSNTICHRHDWWEHLKVPTGYSPGDPDYHHLTLGRNDRIAVNVTDDSLGIQVIEATSSGRNVVAKLAPGAPESSLKHIVTSPGTYHVLISGEKNVPHHFLSIQRIRAAGLDKLEPNDEPSTATNLPSPTGKNSKDYDLLSIAGTDEDYFAINLQPGETLNATLTHKRTPATINLSIVTPDGDAAVSSTGASGQGIGQQNTKPHVVNYTAQDTGTHYVRVNATRDAALYYNLTVVTELAPGPTRPDWMPEKRYKIEDLEVDTWHERDVPTPEEIAKAAMIEEIGINPDTPTPGEDFEMTVRTGLEVPRTVPLLEERLGTTGLTYMEVEHSEEFDGQARVRGSVDRATLAENDAGPDDISVHRHPGPGTGDGWRALETKVVEESEEKVKVEAVSDGLSVFAIAVGGQSEETAGDTERDAIGPGVGGTLAAVLSVALAARRRAAG